MCTTTTTYVTTYHQHHNTSPGDVNRATVCTKTPFILFKSSALRSLKISGSLGQSRISPNALVSLKRHRSEPEIAGAMICML